MKNATLKILSLATIFLASSVANAEIFTVKSPDKQTEAIVETTPQNITVKVVYKGKVLIEKASFLMTTDKVDLGRNSAVYSLDKRFDHNAKAPNSNFNQIELNVGDSAYRFMFRAFDDGVFACRFTTAMGESDFTIYDDIVKIIPRKGSTISICLDKTPAIAKSTFENFTVLIAESAPTAGYPSLTLMLNKNTLSSLFKKIKNSEDDEPDYIYQSKAGTRFPWRIFAMSDKGDAPQKLQKARAQLAVEPKKIN